MFCTKCGKELNSGDRFCAHCGAETKQNEPQLHKYEDVVFNPPFRIEAERKTAEIMKAREELKGFSENESEAPKETKVHEKLSINWNLDGLPITEQKKTEDINFDWGEVVERRNPSTNEPLGKFEFEPILAGKETGLGKGYIEKPVVSNKGDRAERILDSLFGAGVGRELLKDEKPEPVVEQININRDAAENESIISLEDLEKELFGGESQPISGTATVQYRPLNVSEVDSNEELDSFFEDREATAFPLDKKPFDPSVTAVFTHTENKLQGLFEGKFNSPKVESNEEPVIEPLFEDIIREAAGLGEVDEPTTEAKPIVMNTDILTERVLNETLDVDSAKNGFDEEKSDEIKPLQNDTQAEVDEGANLYDELFNEPELSAEERANQKFYTFNRNTEAFKELLRREKERLEKMGADYVPQNQAEEKTEKKQPSKNKLIYVSTALPAVTTNVDATGSKQVVISGPGLIKETPAAENGKPEENKTTKDSDNFKYADVFKGTESGNTFTSAGMSISEEKLSQKTEKAQQLKEFFDEIDKEDPKRSGIFGKIILTIFIIALLVCGTAFCAKYFFPDSIVAEYSDMAIEKGLRFIDQIRGNDEVVELSDEDVTVDTGAESRAAYLGKVISINSANLMTVGEVYYLGDDSIRFNKLTSPAFEDVKEVPDLTVAEGISNYDANPVIAALLRYYDSWLENNDDKDRLGINKLEICDVKINDDVAYVLSRLSFATESGEEDQILETAKIEIAEDAAVVKEVMEEKLK